MGRWMPWVLVVALACALGFALVGKSAPTEPPPIAAEPTRESPDPGMLGAPPATEPPAEPGEATLEGVVREHLDVPQYTYLHLATDAGDLWAAVYRGPVKDGARVVVEHAARLEGFHSKELNRDFPVIYFGTLPGVTTAPTVAAMASSVPSGAVAPSAAMPRPKGALAIATLAAQAASLRGTSVTVAGRVVKETDGILDRNWIHLKDGTGDAKAGTDDVLVTTTDTSKVGVDVVVTGTVNVDQDFGSGYAYKFMIEHAAVRPATSL